MTVGKLAIRAGVNTNATQTQNAGGWSLCNLIRWKNGFLEKMGGWKRLFNGSAAGYVRALHAFEDLDTNLNLLLGGDGGLQVYADGSLYTIILANYQVNATSASSATFVTTAGATLVSVNDPGYSPVTGSNVYLPMTMNIGGRVYQPASYVVTRTGATTYTFNTPLAATSNSGATIPIFTITSPDIGTSTVRVTLSNHNLVAGGTFDVQFTTTLGTSGVTLFGRYPVTSAVSATVFTINSGQVSTAANGVGNPEGDGNTIGKAYVWYYSAQPASPPNWFLDNLGNNSTVSYTNSGLYVWTPPAVFGTNVAPLVTTAPAINAGSFVAMPQAQIITFGASALGVQDPLLIAWSDAGSYSVWTATSANQAGTYRLSRGSRIIGGLQAPQTTLIWTDTDLWSMQYSGPPFVYGFTIIGTGCGLISPKARTTIGGITFWMGRDGFWRYDGSAVTPLSCDVWDVAFNNIDRNNVNKCFAGASSSFQDVYFFYPSLTGGGEVDSYVKVNFSTAAPLWDYGVLTRTAWIDNNVFGPPMGADGNFRIQQHETGYDNDDQPMTGSYAETGMFDVGDGSDILSIQQIQPDCKFFGANGYNMLTLWSQNYAGGSVRMSGPYPMTPTTQYVSPRVRARQMALRIDLCPVKGASARMGAFRVKSQPAGTQP